jgi:hypothetical protein
VPVSKGDLAIIDEDDLCAVVARRLYADFELFKRLGEKPISLTEAANLDPKDSKHFTNLLSLVTVNRRLRPLLRRRRGTEEVSPANVLAMTAVAEGFFRFVAAHCPDLKRLFGKRVTVAHLRNTKNSLLVRPLGLELLARIYVHCSKAEKLEALHRGLPLIDFDLAGEHFNRLLWTGSRIEAKNARVAFNLILHLLRLESRAGLTEEYGRAVKNPDAKLPRPVL